MPGPEFPDAPPPEVPEEFAAAYREAYRRALASGPDDRAQHASAAPVGSDARLAQRPVHELGEDSGASRLERWRASRWFKASVVTGAAVMLVGAAYVVGASFPGPEDGAKTDGLTPQSSRTTEPDRPGSPSQPIATRTSSVHVPNAWEGPVVQVSVDAIAADCTAPPGTDSAGKKVTYVPENAADGRAQTAWRCAGTAIGHKLTLRLSEIVDIARVGLVPGYAKTDPDSGVDRYAENNRITRVRWTLADGVSIVQRLDPDPSSRAMQVLRVPRTATDTITLEILAVRPGSRDTTAISELSLAATG